MSKLVGLVGWRGMVGSVLIDRMIQEKDFDLIEPLFFSTSNAGGAAPAQAKNEKTLQNAFDIDQLKRCDIIITAQGGDAFGEYTVPLAILTLQQGLGRLIRHRKDRGVLAILDPRTRTMGYGRRFIASVPPAPVVHDLDAVEAFFSIV